jgi:hypothetical protein
MSRDTPDPEWCAERYCTGIAVVGQFCELHSQLRKRAKKMPEKENYRIRPGQVIRHHSPNLNDGEYSEKATNPKDQIGSGKVGTNTVPDAVKFFAALATTEGALKYGAANWSEAGVRCSIYLDALDRHIAKFKAGEWMDERTKVPHLSSALACIGIILDAHLRRQIVDDRPPPNPELVRWLDRAEGVVAHLKQTFAGPDPKHYNMSTIGLAPEGELWMGDNRSEPLETE